MSELPKTPEKVDRFRKYLSDITTAIGRLDNHLNGLEHRMNKGDISQEEMDQIQDHLRSALQFAELAEHELSPTKKEDDARANELADQ